MTVSVDLKEADQKRLSELISTVGVNKGGKHES